MMLKRMCLMGTVVMLMAASMAWAQDTPKFELTPFIGATVGGGIPLRMSVGTGTVELGTLDIKSGLNAGVSFGYNVTERFGTEFLWRRQFTETDLPTTAVPVGASTKVDLNIDQYHGNFLYHFADSDAATRPYMLFGLGATTYYGSNNEISDAFTKFSMGFGGGVKHFFAKRVGVRAEVRWTPTYLYSTAGGVWCWYYCYVLTADTWQNQVDFTAGLVFRF